MYKVIGKLRTRTLRVLWMLEELGLDYEHISVSPHSPQILGVNPSGKVPALVVDGQAILDSTAIITFLADRHGSKTFPAGKVLRAQQDSLTQLICDEVDAVLWAASRHGSIEGVRDAMNRDLTKAWKTLESRLGNGPNLMGAEFTVPDILLTHCGGWAKTTGFDMPTGRLADYFKRQISRPAYKRMFKRAVQLEAK